MNFFTNAGAFVARKANDIRNFIFPAPPIKRASQPTLTAGHQTTSFPQQKQAQTTGFFGRIGSGFRKARDIAVRGFDKAKVGFKSIFVPKEIKTVKGELKKSASEIAVTGIKTLSSIIKNKIGGTGQSGTPIDIRPEVASRAPKTTDQGNPNILGGFEFPFLGSLVGQSQAAIPIVGDSEPPPVASSSTVVQSEQGGGSGFSNIGTLVVIGLIIFFIFRGRK